jgi:hypothetical protein
MGVKDVALYLCLMSVRQNCDCIPIFSYHISDPIVMFSCTPGTAHAQRLHGVGEWLREK